jgi:hypothetical protein
MPVHRPAIDTKMLRHLFDAAAAQRQRIAHQPADLFHERHVGREIIASRYWRAYRDMTGSADGSGPARSSAPQTIPLKSALPVRRFQRPFRSARSVALLRQDLWDGVPVDAPFDPTSLCGECVS